MHAQNFNSMQRVRRSLFFLHCRSYKNYAPNYSTISHAITFLNLPISNKMLRNHIFGSDTHTHTVDYDANDAWRVCVFFAQFVNAPKCFLVFSVPFNVIYLHLCFLLQSTKHDLSPVMAMLLHLLTNHQMNCK